MTTDKYITLTDYAGNLCVDYVECVHNIESYTTDVINGISDSAILLSVARQRRDDILQHLQINERLAIDILSDREFTRYMQYVNAMISPLSM